MQNENWMNNQHGHILSSVPVFLNQTHIVDTMAEEKSVFFWVVFS